MDPVSTATAVLAFATAVKDIVELAQKIYESFAKVSKNRRKAKRTAENIKAMVDEIRVFGEAHKGTLANMKEFTAALEELLKKFRDFEASILPLVAQRRGFLRATVFLRGWLNNNQIEESISEVESDVVNVMRKYMMQGTMRIEVRQEVNHQDTTQRLEGLSQGLAVISTNVHAIRTGATIASIGPTTLGTSDERERNVVLFVRSTMSKPTSLLRPPDEVTEEMMMTVFIKSQMACIKAEVDKISTLPVSGPIDTRSLSVFLSTTPSMEVACLRRTVVQDIMELRNILSDANNLLDIAINDAIQKLSSLSVGLDHLEMTEDTILVCCWAVRLARTLVNRESSRGGETQDRADLAFQLCMLSRLYYHSSNSVHIGQQEIEEALSITERLLSQDCTDDAEIQGICVDILIHYAKYAPDGESAINRCMQAIQLLEGIFNVQTLARVDSQGTTGAVVDPSYNLVNHLFSSSPEPIMIDRCIDVLQDLAAHMLRAGCHDGAKCVARLSIALSREMISVHGHAYRASLADNLSFICRGELATCFTDNELLDMANEGALLFRQLTHTNPVVYSRRLLYILQRKAEVLDQLNSHTESISTWEEVIRLACQVTQDFELQTEALFGLAQGLCELDKYLDAAIAMARIPATFRDEWHASFYTDLSLDLLITRHWSQSADAAKNSIAIFRDLGLQRPDVRWTSGLARALHLLGLSLIHLGDQDQGIAALDESVIIAGNVLNASPLPLPATLKNCLDAFVAHAWFCGGSGDTSIQRLQLLATHYPQNQAIFEALSEVQADYAYNLYHAGRLQDALNHINKCIDNWVTDKGESTGPPLRLAEMTWIKAETLSAQGCVTEALLGTQSPQSTHNTPLEAERMLLLLVCRVKLEVSLGKWEKGLEVCEEALQQSRSDQGHLQWMPVLICFGTAYTALHGQSYQSTIEAAREGIELSSAPEWQHKEYEYNISIRPSLFAIMSSAEANTGNLDRAMHYARQAVTLSLDIAEQRHVITSTTAKHSLVETRGYLAEILLATGDLTQARQICDERRAYFTERVKDRMGEWRDLAPILRMLGVLCCHEGRHEQGEAAARELTDIINRLGLVFPSLQDQVKIRLRYQANVPILKVLDEMTEKLGCEHQKGITDSFKD